jgi:hypothetical protein
MLLVSPRGEPVPPSSVLKRLAAVDERLSLRWMPSPLTGPYWALVERWRRGDPRWERVQSGELTEDHAVDMVAMLPPDCSVHDVEGWMLRKFGRVIDPEKEAAQQIERLQQANEKRKVTIREQFLVDQEEKHRRQTKHELEVSVGAATAHPMVSGVGDGTIKQGRKMRRPT